MSEVDICNRALSIIGENASVSAITPPDGSPHAALCALWLPHAREVVLEEFNWNCASQRVALAHPVLSVTNVNTTNNRLTLSAAHGLVDNNVVRVAATTTMPAPLEALTDYYVRYVSSTVVELAEEEDGDAIDISGAGSGTITLEKRSTRPGWAYAYAAPSDMQKPLAVVDAAAPDHDQSMDSYMPPLSTYVPAPLPVLSTYPVPITDSGQPFKVALNGAGETCIYTNVEDAHLLYQAYVTDTDQWPAGMAEAVMWRLAAFLAGAIKRSEATANWCMQMFDRALGKAAARDGNASNLPIAQHHPWDRG